MKSALANGSSTQKFFYQLPSYCILPLFRSCLNPQTQPKMANNGGLHEVQTGSGRLADKVAIVTGMSVLYLSTHQSD
jgi:hypothetical protein